MTQFPNHPIKIIYLDNPIMTIHLDNIGEFNSNPLLCLEYDVEYPIIHVHTQNGLVSLLSKISK